MDAEKRLPLSEHSLPAPSRAMWLGQPRHGRVASSHPSHWRITTPAWLRLADGCPSRNRLLRASTCRLGGGGGCGDGGGEMMGNGGGGHGLGGGKGTPEGGGGGGGAGEGGGGAGGGGGGEGGGGKGGGGAGGSKGGGEGGGLMKSCGRK